VSAAAPADDHSLRAALRRIGRTDWLMLALALVSVGLLAYETWGSATPGQTRWILRADYTVCFIFLLEFLWCWRRAGWTWRHLAHHWYDVLGMIPVSQPALRGFRLFRLLRILILLSRFGMAADRALGEEFTWRLVDRFKKQIVDAISGPVTVAVLEEVADVLKKGTYTRNIARALDENHAELRAMITDKLRDNPDTGRLRRVPFYNDIVAGTVDAALAVVQEVLRDPRTDELVGDMLRENIDQIREAVKRNQ
jgi:voltage-gated potassium channel